MTERDHVGDWATDWDHLGRQSHEEAPRVWADLRARCPVAHTERFEGAWLPVNYADQMTVTHDTVTFSSHETNLFDVRQGRPPVLPPITLDPPEHMKYRRILQPMFTPLAVRRFAPRAEALCHQLIDAFIGAGRADAGVDYAQHVPVIVTAEILGVPTSGADRFRHWIHDMLEVGQSEPEVGVRAAREVGDYLQEQLAYRRTRPGDDAISVVDDAEVDGEPLDEPTKVRMLLLLLIGGIDTTWAVLGAALWHLATHPEDQDRLRREPQLQRVPEFRLQERATVEWTTGGNVRGPRVIPVEF